MPGRGEVVTRVAWLGNFRPEESTEQHWRYAFEQLGVEVVPVQQDTCTEEAWEIAASNADAAAISTTWDWPLPCTPDTWMRLNARGVKTFSAHLDLIFGLDRGGFTVDGHPQFYGPEHVWTADGDHDDEWARRGVNHHWLAPAIHEPNARRGVYRDEWACDVVFTGSVDGYHPEHPRRRELIAAASARYGNRFRLIGGANAVRGPELADVYASARVVLGDSLCIAREQSKYLSDRVPEVAGRGGVLVHPANVATSDFYQCGEWSTWDIDNQLDLVDWMLTCNDALLERVRAAAHLAVLERHTYTHRAADILKTIGLGVKVAA